MKFEDYQYQRIDVQSFKEKLVVKLELLKEATEFKQFKDTLDQIYKEFSSIESMQTLASIRYSINTTDSFYIEEQSYWDNNAPYLIQIINQVYEIVRNNKHLDELKRVYPETYFLKSEMELKTFDDCIIGDLQNENILVSKYSQLMASAQIEFDGEIYTLASLGSKLTDKDESTRERAYIAYWGFMEEKEQELDTLFDELVQLRTSIARKLGYENFIELGYLRMQRLDYTQKDVEMYRQQVLQDVVPLANKLYQAQKKRIGVDTLKCYNLTYEFKSGNPTPKHNEQEMVNIAKKMYAELSPETNEFFSFMSENHLMDLSAKPGKAPGGYCTYISQYQAPFIFSNFNGTRADVDVLTHEAGHAFQAYCSRGIQPESCMWPTLESCEIHSMSMEFFTWPWMKDFFEDEYEKYYYMHLSSAIKFLPYGVLVDHYQHEVYKKPEMSVEDRKNTWRTLEKQYLPHLDYSDIPILEKGTWWFKQLHIFTSPFYYIDYTLAQVCALQFWQRIHNKDKTAFEDYVKICKLGGTLPFTKIVEAANINNPFSSGCLKEVCNDISNYLDQIDDMKLN